MREDDERARARLARAYPRDWSTDDATVVICAGTVESALEAASGVVDVDTATKRSKGCDRG